jgi:hypothetical protein
MNLALHVEPGANFYNQRRLIAYAPILQRSFLPTRMIVTKRVAQ